MKKIIAAIWFLSLFLMIGTIENLNAMFWISFAAFAATSIRMKDIDPSGLNHDTDR